MNTLNYVAQDKAGIGRNGDERQELGDNIKSRDAIIYFVAIVLSIVVIVGVSSILIALSNAATPAQVLGMDDHTVTVIAYPSAIGDLDLYSYKPYKVVWDRDKIHELYGQFLYNNKGTFEGEISIRGANDARQEDIDFSGLTGHEKIQYGKSGSVAK
ncbi:MAG: hypothetical protein EZS28_035869, partial [Streblomastix strix]